MDFIRVEDCCEILDSQRKPVTESERVPGMYPYYGANGLQGTINQYIFDDKLVLVAEDGCHFGSKTKPITYLVNGKCWVNNHAHVLRAKKGFLAEYICYSLMFYKIEGYINGATRQKLTQAALRKLIIPKRPIEYQKAIVDRLDLVKCIIEKKQIIINELDLLIKSRFVELISKNKLIYQKVRLKDCCLISSGATPSRKNSDYWDENGINWFKTTELKNNFLIDSEERISELGYEKTSVKLLPKHTVLIAMYGQGKTRGMTGYLLNNATTNQACAALISLDIINPKYLWYTMINSYDRLRNMAKGGTQPNLSVSSIKDFEIILPPIDIQNKFTNYIEQINKLKSDVQKSIDETQLLMDSLMQEYFG